MNILVKILPFLKSNRISKKDNLYLNKKYKIYPSDEFYNIVQHYKNLVKENEKLC